MRLQDRLVYATMVAVWVLVVYMSMTQKRAPDASRPAVGASARLAAKEALGFSTEDEEQFQEKRTVPSVLKEAVSAKRLLDANSRVGSRSSTNTNATILIGVGCQKCGTSSMSSYLELVQWAKKARAKELHFFDIEPFVHLDHTSMASEELLESYRDRYAQMWPKSLVTAESNADARIPFEISPSYMMQRQTPWAMRRILGKEADAVKLLFILRNPTKRAFSGLFQVAPKSTAAEFASLIKNEVSVLENCYADALALPEDSSQCPTGTKQNKHLLACTTAYTARTGDATPWFQRHTRVLGFEHKYTNGSALWRNEGLVIRGLYLDQVRNFVCAGFHPEQMLIITANELYSDQMSALLRLSEFVGQTLTFATPENEKTVREGIFRNHKSRGAIDETSLRLLNTFYAPHNKKLVDYLLAGNFNINRDALLQEFGLDSSSV